MIESLVQKRYFAIILFLFSFGYFAVNNWGYSLYILDEAKNTECAREMFEQHEFFKPTFNYNLRTDKPPLHYFFMMISYSVFGVNEFGARFFSAIFGALTILATFIFASKFLNRRTASWAVLILLASIHLNIEFHLAVPDPYLIFFFCLSIFFFYSALTAGRLSDKIGMYVSMGLAVLAKGPVAIALPGMAFLFFLIFSKNLKWATIKKLKPFAGAMIVLAIALPWFIANGVKTDWVWTHDFFFKHNINRFSNKMEGHGGIFLITFGYVLMGLLPFSLFFIQAFRQAWKERNNKFILFCLTVALTIIVFFSISGTKLPNYTIPSYPFLAIILANYLANLKKTTAFHLIYTTLILSTLALPIAGYFLVKSYPSLSHLCNKTWWLLILPAGTLVAYLQFIKKKTEKSLLTLAVTPMVAVILLFIFVFPVVDKDNPVQKSLGILKGKEVVSYKKFNASYPFYLKEKIPMIEGSEIDSFFVKNPGGAIISTKKEAGKIGLPENCEVVFSGKDLLELPTTVIITKKH
jgi:4-amino-4-deoxy-L-arabinose transferase-like glycosyltransferase